MVRRLLMLRLAGPTIPLLLGGTVAACGARWLVHGDHLGDRAGLALTAAVLLGLVLGLVGAVRGAARALAGRRSGAGPSRESRLRRRLALLAPPCVMLLAILFARASFVDASVALAALLGDGDASPTALALGPGGSDVRLAGEITEGAAGRLAALLDANPAVTRIHLTSEGGLADEGQKLGDVIAAHALVTFVPDYCVSACTLAFARGRERIAMDDARIGYHAPYEQGLFGALYRDDGEGQRAAYLAAGIAPAFVERALAVDPAGLWFPTHAELLAAGAVTRIVDQDALPDSSLDGAATPAAARALVLQNHPVLQALADRRPQAMARIVSWYLESYRRGATEGEDARGLRLLARAATASALAHADDGVMRDLGRFLLRALDDVPDGARDGVSDPAACARIADEGDLAEAASLLRRRERGAVGEAAVLLGRALRPDGTAAAAPPPPPAAVMLAATVQSCAARRRDLDALLSGPQGPAALRARLAASVVRSLKRLPHGLPPT